LLYYLGKVQYSGNLPVFQRVPRISPGAWSSLFVSGLAGIFSNYAGAFSGSPAVRV
jgi:hypothetical protein